MDDHLGHVDQHPELIQLEFDTHQNRIHLDHEQHLAHLYNLIVFQAFDAKNVRIMLYTLIAVLNLCMQTSVQLLKKTQSHLLKGSSNKQWYKLFSVTIELFYGLYHIDQKLLPGIIEFDKREWYIPCKFYINEIDASILVKDIFQISLFHIAW